MVRLYDIFRIHSIELQRVLGVVGIICATIAIRYICRVKLEVEEEELNAHESNAAAKPYLMHLIVQNEYLAGRTILEIHDFLKRDFVCSRILRGTELLIFYFCNITVNQLAIPHEYLLVSTLQPSVIYF